MRFLARFKRGLLISLPGCLLAANCRAQDLAPRAYLITPLHSNALNVSYSFFDGNIDFPGSVPITGATATVHVSTLTFSHSLNFFGRTANFSASLPYGVGNFSASVMGAGKTVYRSGLLGASFRLSVNLIGGPAMNVEEFRHWKQKHILGVSIRLVPPTGQYNPTALINFGTNRWAFKPEMGYSRRWGHWILESFGGAWIFTTNPEFFSNNQYSSGVNRLSQNPIGVFEGHLDYDFKPRLWVSLDGNFWFGGSSNLNGVPTAGTLQRSSRVGGTVSIPFTKHQSIKFSYSRGAVVLYSGDYQLVAVGWQYSWLGRPN